MQTVQTVQTIQTGQAAGTIQTVQRTQGFVVQQQLGSFQAETVQDRLEAKLDSRKLGKMATCVDVRFKSRMDCWRAEASTGRSMRS